MARRPTIVTFARFAFVVLLLGGGGSVRAGTDEEAMFAALFEDPETPVLGNPDGDVTIVEFFDYRCPYCRRVAPAVAALLAEDPGIRLVLKEWPILGPKSVEAARAALAAHGQGHYAAVHEALMAGTLDVDAQAIVAFAAERGADPEAMRLDMDSDRVTRLLVMNDRLAAALRFTGTPAFVIGEQTVPGAVPIEMLREMVAAARAAP